MTDYPAVTVRPGTTSTVPLRLQNYDLAPERYRSRSPACRPAGPRRCSAAASRSPPRCRRRIQCRLQLRLDVPANAGMAAQTLTVKAEGQGKQVEPADQHRARQGAAGQARRPVEAAFAARTPKSSFEYTLTIKNDSGRNLVTSFAAEAPRNFETSFTEAYGTQELSSIPIDAGQSKDIKLKVRPPGTVDAGHFPVKVTVKAEDASAKTELALEIVGQPRLQVVRT